MKVILTAFGGKLKSDIMDWPENSGLEIRMVLDSDVSPVLQRYQEKNEGDMYVAPMRPVVGIFRSTGKMISRGKHPGPLGYEFRLYDISK